jgi:hypothetical protein
MATVPAAAVPAAIAPVFRNLRRVTELASFFMEITSS